MIRTSLLALALVALTGTAFAQTASPAASDAGMTASSSATKTPAKHHHKKHAAASSSSSSSDAGMAASPAAPASGK